MKNILAVWVLRMPSGAALSLDVFGFIWPSETGIFLRDGRDKRHEKSIRKPYW